MLEPPHSGRRRGRAWRALYVFWGALVIGLGAGAIALHLLGPPKQSQPIAGLPDHVAAESPAGPHPAPSKPVASVPHPPPVEARNEAAASRPTPGAPTAGPDPALLEPSVAFPNASLPKIGPDRRTSLQTYAAGFDPADPRPRVAILVSGIGMSEADGDEAVRSLPAAVSLAMSPYAARPERLLEAARAQGHELFVSIPMEPQGYPLNDAGNRALLTGAPLMQNQERLEWALSRVSGYVGATSALEGVMRGERFSASEQMVDLLGTLAARGLMYVDAAPNVLRPQGLAAVAVASRSVDVVIDDPAVRTEIDDRLARLERLAQERGSALGLAGIPRPVTVARIAAWSGTLGARGLVLVPVSALAKLPTSARTSLAR